MSIRDHISPAMQKLVRIAIIPQKIVSELGANFAYHPIASLNSGGFFFSFCHRHDINSVRSSTRNSDSQLVFAGLPFCGAAIFNLGFPEHDRDSCRRIGGRGRNLVRRVGGCGCVLQRIRGERRSHCQQPNRQPREGRYVFAVTVPSADAIAWPKPLTSTTRYLWPLVVATTRSSTTSVQPVVSNCDR